MMQDESWHRVRIAAAEAELSDDTAKTPHHKVGGLREIHRKMYDEARTASDVFALEAEALGEIDRLVLLPKPRTIDERLKTLEDERLHPATL